MDNLEGEPVMDNDLLKQVLFEIRDDVKEIRQMLVVQGKEIAKFQTKVNFVEWISKSTALVVLGAFVSWLKSKAG